MPLLNMIGGFFQGFFRPKLSAPEDPSAGGSLVPSRRQLSAPGSHGAKWLGGLSASGLSPNLNHAFLRQNARMAWHTSLQARAIIERHNDTVVSDGLKLSSTPDAETLGITAEAAEEWSSGVDAGFHNWAQSKKASLAETMTFYQMQSLANVSQQRDGEYFCRFAYSARKDLLNPLQLQFLDPNQITGVGFTSTYGFNDLFKDGIKRDSNGKEVAYQVMVRGPDGTPKPATIPAMGPRSKRTMMIHGYLPEYAGQGRGFSRLAHALQEFEKITDFSSAEVQKAIAQSCMFGWVKPSPENPASDIFEDITRQAPVGPSGITPAAQALAEANNVDPEDLVDFIPIPEATQKVPGSMFVGNLKEGEEVKPFQNTSPVESFEAFINTLAGHISASMSIPLELVLMKFGTSFSASRAALVLFWRVAVKWRIELASDFLNVVYENWLAGEIAAGRIVAPGWSDPRMREAWLANTWIGVPMPSIDPAKTAKAEKDNIEMGATDLDRVAREHNGSDGKANRARLRRQLAELVPVPWAKGSNPDAAGGGEGAGDSDDGDPKEDDDQ